MNVHVIAGNTTHRGPGKLYQNLVKGLQLTGHSVNQTSIEEADFTACVQMSSNIMTLDPSKTLFGPNLVVLPTEFRDLFSDPRRHFLSPSEWTKSKYSTFEFTHGDNFHLWPVGIDTETWKPSTASAITQDCFIYFKNRSRDDLRVVQMLLNKCGLKYTILEYGHYDEHQLKLACDTSRFAVLLTGTESQGIAYMEILSTNTPCYVFNKPTWESDDGALKFPASSVPYFDSMCGSMCPGSVTLDHFQGWLGDLEKGLYDPRTYIVNNHTLELSANKLVEIATKVLPL